MLLALRFWACASGLLHVLIEGHTLQCGADIGHATGDEHAFGLLAGFALQDFQLTRGCGDCFSR